MSYSKLLKKLAVESGYTSTEIIEKCKENGVNIDKSYYSKILNGKLPAPSEDYSRIFAKVLGVDERLLVLEGYLDKAPKEVVECLNKIKELMINTSLKVYENEFDNLDLENIVNELSTSNFIVEILDADINTKTNNLMKISNKNENDINIKLSEIVSLPVTDNSMFPLIPEKSKITLKIEQNYQNGDVLAIKTKDFDKAIVRYVLFDNKNVILTSLNKEYETLTYNLKDIEILGKVNQVITNI